MKALPHKASLWHLERRPMFGIQDYYSTQKYMKRLGKFKTEKSTRNFIREYSMKRYKETGVVNWLMYPINLDKK